MYWVVVGATESGTKELVALEGGFSEREVSWTPLLLDLKGRGLAKGPKLAEGYGALVFWKALSKTYGNTRWQRCWVHKTATVMNRLPKSLQSKTKLNEIWMAADKDQGKRHPQRLPEVIRGFDLVNGIEDANEKRIAA